jgi:hypothetical protein
VQAERSEQRRHRALLRVEDQDPDQADDRDAERDRQEHEQAAERREAPRADQLVREQQRQHVLPDGDRDHEDQAGDDALLEARCLGRTDRGVVGEPQVVHCLARQPGVVGERDDDVPDHRHNAEKHVDGQPEQQAAPHHDPRRAAQQPGGLRPADPPRRGRAGAGRGHGCAP